MTWDMAQNCEMMLVSTDAETTTWGFNEQFASLVMYWLSEIGIEQVYITPDLNYAAAVHADKWIPVLPCQDAALYLAVCYVWLTEDTYDKEYLSTHALGFDKFAAYVLGNEPDDPEGPKTPEWAAPKCGVPVWTIKALARNWYQKKTSLVGFTGPGMRSSLRYFSLPGISWSGRRKRAWIHVTLCRDTPSDVWALLFDPLV